MGSPHVFAAKILETSASAYAGMSAGLLLENRPDIAERFAPSAMRDWKANFRQRILELAAALHAGEPSIFKSRVKWQRKAFSARRLEESDLQSSLDVLRQVLLEELPEPAKNGVAGYLETAMESFEETLGEDHPLSLDDPFEELALRYLEPALRGDGGDAIDVLVQAVESERVSICDAYNVLLTAQKEVGRLWHLGELRVAEEHVVTMTAERATSALFRLTDRQPSIGRTAIVAAVADNRHSLPVRILADLFEAAGWRSICLGADVPPADLAAAVSYFEADLLALSVALPTQLKTAHHTIEAVKDTASEDIKIIVGGGAFDDAHDLWQKLGADGFLPDLEGAVELGRSLVDQRPTVEV